MFPWILYSLYFCLTVGAGFVLGMIFEHKRMMSRLKELAEEFTPCCENCLEYDGDHCMKNWNNADPDYYCPDTDDKEPDDYCEDWRLDESAID